MKVAITYENGNIFEHFGHTEHFLICEIEQNKVIKATVTPTNGAGHGALALFLREHNIDTLICGGIGTGAINALKNQNIKVYAGCHGLAIKAVEALLEGNLSYNPNANCNHHGHDHDCEGHCSSPKMKRNI